YIATSDEVGSITTLRVERLADALPPVGPDDGERSGPGNDPPMRVYPNAHPRYGACGWVINGSSTADEIDGRGYPTGQRIDVHGLAGDDQLSGSQNGDCLFGGPGDDKLTGQGGDDLLKG